MAIVNIREYLHKYCRVEFRFSDEPVRTMYYDGMVEAVIDDGEQPAHIVLNAHYAGRVPIELDVIQSMEELPYETSESTYW